MRITSNGYVGIGTSSPGAKLDVNGSSNPQIRITNTGGADTLAELLIDGGTYASATTTRAQLTLNGNHTGAGEVARIYYKEAGNLKFQTYYSSFGDFFGIRNGTASYNQPALAITDDNNVGIGTSSPTTKLEVKDGSIYTHGSAGGQGRVVMKLEGGNQFEWYPLTTGFRLYDRTKGFARLFISNDGEVGINNSSPNVALDVGGDIQYTGTITDVSDKRLKENIRPIKNSLEKLKEIKGVYFNMIGEEKIEMGVIAQEVNKTLPEAVKIIDKEKGYLGVSYPSLTPVLINAIQEQQKIIENQKKLIKTNTNQINALKKLICKNNLNEKICK